MVIGYVHSFFIALEKLSSKEMIPNYSLITKHYNTKTDTIKLG